MKATLGSAITAVVLCSTGCQSFGPVLYQSISHSVGAITQLDLSRDNLMRCAGMSSNKPLVLINCAIWGCDRVGLEHRHSLRQWYSLSQGLLMMHKVSSDIAPRLGWRPTTIVLRVGKATPQFLYMNDTILGCQALIATSEPLGQIRPQIEQRPWWRRSCKQEPRDPGIVQVLDQFSVVSNEVARTLLGSLNEIRTSSPCFPFEVSKTTKSGLDDVIEVDVNSGNTREQIATSPTEIAVLNARLRDRFTQLVRVTWPRRLLCFADSSDVVWMSWDGYASENEVSSNTHLGCYNMAMVS